MTPRPMSLLLAAVSRHTAMAGSLLGLSACFSIPPDAAPVTSQRGTLSSDTATTAAGTIEFEVGATVDPRQAFDSPIVAKWGMHECSELYAQWSPYQWVARPDSDAQGIGDLLLGLRHRFLDEEGSAPSAAFQVTTRLPTGDQAAGLSSGEIDFFAAGILTKNLGPVTTTAFYEAGLISDPAAPDVDLAHIVALAGAMPLNQRWGLFGEVGAVIEPARNTEAWIGTLGGSYAVAESFLLDVGVSVGLSDDAPDLLINFGFTWNVGRRPLSVLQ